MSSIKGSIKKTVAYSAYFNFPLTTDEIHYWLISPHQIARHQISSQPLSPEERLLRLNRANTSTIKINKVKDLSTLFKIFFTIKLVAVTGSVAVNNAKEGDDIDLMIVTSPHTLWLTRLFFLLLLPLWHPRRRPLLNYHQAKDLICPNLWLETGSLEISRDKRNVFTAHEVLQAIPIYDRENTYNKFINLNSWVKKYLANAYIHITSSYLYVHHKDKFSFSFLFVPLNLICYMLQLVYMFPKKTVEDIGYSHAFFHQVDFANKIKKHLKSPK